MQRHRIGSKEAMAEFMKNGRTSPIRPITRRSTSDKLRLRYKALRLWLGAFFPITLVVIPDECQSMPMTAPNDWNQKGERGGAATRRARNGAQSLDSSRRQDGSCDPRASPARVRHEAEGGHFPFCPPSNQPFDLLRVLKVTEYRKLSTGGMLCCHS